MQMEAEGGESKIRISLRAARICSGYSTEAAAEIINISTDSLREYESDAREMPICTAVKLLELYRFPFHLIHFGNESEFIKGRNHI